MGILWCTKAPRADIYSQFVSALRTTAGASSADRVGRDPCVPPRSTHCSRRGTRASPYRVRRSHGADRVVRPYTFCAGRGGRRPPTHLVIASQSAPRSKCPWGTDWRGNPFPARQGRADGASYPKGICSAALHCRTPSPTKSQGVRCKKADRCPPFTFLLYMIALSATMRCKNTAPACPAPHGHR